MTLLGLKNLTAVPIPFSFLSFCSLQLTKSTVIMYLLSLVVIVCMLAVNIQAADVESANLRATIQKVKTTSFTRYYYTIL